MKQYCVVVSESPNFWDDGPLMVIGPFSTVIQAVAHEEYINEYTSQVATTVDIVPGVQFNKQ